jgi:hypothetical protein
VIKAAKRLHYERLINASNNKMKTWKIVNSITDKRTSYIVLQSRDVYNLLKSIEKQREIVDASQNYFLSVADKIKSSIHSKKIPNNNNNLNKDSMDYLYSLQEEIFHDKTDI